LLKAPLLLKSFAIVMFVILTQILEYFVEVVFVYRSSVEIPSNSIKYAKI
jgi:hypothetical protein